MSTLSGKLVTLRPLSASDLDALNAIRGNLSVLPQGITAAPRPDFTEQLKRQLKTDAEKPVAFESDVQFSIWTVKDARLVGHGSLEQINLQQRSVRSRRCSF